MKKRCIILNHATVRIMMFLILGLIATSSHAARSVREIMKTEVTDISSLYTFYTNHNSSYERRYFLKYLPDYLIKFGISEIPEWVTNAFDDALDSDYVPLAIAAAKSIGALKLDSFSDKMTERFITSEKKAYLSLSYRIAVLEAFKRFDNSEKVKGNVSRLLKNFPQERVFDPDFTELMEVAILFCVKSDMVMLSRFENRIATMPETQAPDERRNPDLERIKGLLQRVKRSLALKGGHDE